MCFYVKKHQRKQIAENDIKCWKLLRENDYGNSCFLVSEFYDFRYVLNKLYEEKLKIKKLEPYERLDNNDYNRVIRQGLHSYSSYDKAKYGSHFLLKIYSAIIPKGAEYYYNKKHQEYVSTQIIITKEL